ncbi:MAG TPA: hypothetical protein VHT75_06855 [Acidimicrobiales bacterium]|jgi:hypothetical protein|nr:hypothetical protein [Acidimicrobiales bacterium]
MTARRSFRLAALAGAVIVATLLPVTASQAVSGIPQIARGGFGDKQNSYSWSMAWFKGKLYVGTNHNELCVERETEQFYHPDQTYYTVHPMPEVTCPANPYDLNLQAEIWQFDPATNRWTMVFQSPNNVPNPRAPGKFVARDTAFRGMVVQHDANGQDALYVGGVTADEYIPELAANNPPRILRTTDGRTFSPLNGAPATLNTANGPFPAMGYRAMVSFNGRLLVTATKGLLGDGVVEEIGQPYSAHPTFTQIMPNTIEAYEMEVFNGSLYVGGGDSKNNTGYAVWKTDAVGVPFSATPIVTGGAGRGNDITSVVSMHVFQSRLYVGSSGWYTTPIPASELIRINPDDSWQLVVGNPRPVNGATVSPISGLPDGFGNPFNAHFWRQADFQSSLFVGTNDWSYTFRFHPTIDKVLRPQYGFDIWNSCDGQYWSALTQNAFGDGLYNFGARTFASTPIGLFVGSANQPQGTAVWKDTAATGCTAPASSSSAGTAPTSSAPVSPASTPAAPSAGALAAPGRLLADSQSCGTVLTWDASPGATSYTVLRTEMAPTTVSVGAKPPTPVSDEAVPDLSPPSGSASTQTTLYVPGSAVTVGTTGTTSYIDSTAKANTHYLYQVVAQAAGGAVSAGSNTALVPSARPATTFNEVTSAITSASVHGDLASGADRVFTRLLQEAQRFAATNRPQAVAVLNQLAASFANGSVTMATAQSDLSDVIFRLERQLTEPTLPCATARVH